MDVRAVTSVYSGPTSTVMSKVASKSVDTGSNVHSHGRHRGSSVDRQCVHSSEWTQLLTREAVSQQETVDESAVHTCITTLHALYRQQWKIGRHGQNLCLYLAARGTHVLS